MRTEAQRHYSLYISICIFILFLKAKKGKQHPKRRHKQLPPDTVASLMRSTVNIVSAQPRPSTRPPSAGVRAKKKTKNHSPHRAVRSGADRRQVLVPLRNLPYSFVQLLPIKSRPGRHCGRRAADWMMGMKREKKGSESGRRRMTGG